MSPSTVRCTNCSEPLGGKYCARCGEKCLEPADHTFRRFLEHLLEAFTHADGKFVLTLRNLLIRPGRLTADYLRGRRKPYIPPLQVFLICNLIFFLLHPLIGSNTLTTDLNTQRHYTWHHGLVESLVTSRLKARALSAEAYAVVFDAAAITLAKTLVILVVPIFSLAVAALYGRQRRHYSAQLVFSLHFGAFWLLLVCTTWTLTNAILGLLRVFHVFPTAAAVGGGTTTFILAVLSVYLFQAVRAVFAAESFAITAAKAIGLALALELSLQAYRLLLFFITFWST